MTECVRCPKEQYDNGTHCAFCPDDYEPNFIQTMCVRSCETGYEGNGGKCTEPVLSALQAFRYRDEQPTNNDQVYCDDEATLSTSGVCAASTSEFQVPPGIPDQHTSLGVLYALVR